MRKELLELFGRRPNLPLDPARLPGFLAEYLRLASRNTDCHPGLLATAWLPHGDCPSTSTWPLVGLINPRINLIRVDLPAPLWPSNPTTLPIGTDVDKPARAATPL